MMLTRLSPRLLDRWIWRDAERRARKLLRFAATESDGGRDLARAAELTADPVLRRLYLVHAADEQRHAELFRRRGAALLRPLPRPRPQLSDGSSAPGERGLDDLRLEHETDAGLLAFLHLSEKVAATDFARYRDLLHGDPTTRAMFEEILRDEAFHTKYTLTQLARVAPRRRRWLLWRARLGRLWKGYLRLATALAGGIGAAILTAQYFILLPPFALLAKRAERRERAGWQPIAPERNGALDRQY